MPHDCSLSDPPILEASDIELRYEHPGRVPHTVLRDFSLRVAAGEVLAVLGPSGVGKSSLLRVLAGLHSPHRGTVAIQGEPLTGPHPRSSFVFQDPTLLPWLTLEENVGFGLDFKQQPAISRGEQRQRVAAAIAEVGLNGAQARYPAELSGGMAQRAALARSLARQPEILLLDEPFSALDEITRGDMQRLLRRIIAHHGSSAILVTHDIDEALILADRIVLIGGAPGSALGEWAVSMPHPRDPLAPELTDIRMAILRLLRAARQSQAPLRAAA